MFFIVMRGEYDALLPWPFEKMVTLSVLDQEGSRHITDTFHPDPASPSFQRPTSFMNIALGCPLFVSLSDLDGGGYVKDDVMYIRIVVGRDEMADSLSNDG